MINYFDDSILHVYPNCIIIYYCTLIIVLGTHFDVPMCVSVICNIFYFFFIRFSIFFTKASKLEIGSWNLFGKKVFNFTILYYVFYILRLRNVMYVTTNRKSNNSRQLERYTKVYFDFTELFVIILQLTWEQKDLKKYVIFVYWSNKIITNLWIYLFNLNGWQPNLIDSKKKPQKYTLSFWHISQRTQNLRERETISIFWLCVNYNLLFYL